MGKLQPGEHLLLSDGSLAIVESTDAAPAPLNNDGEPIPFTTYNFEVEDWHTYFVKPEHTATAAPSVWVHNTGFKPCDEIIDAYKRHPDLVKKMNLDPKVNDWLNKNVLPNKAPVVRGGANTPESIAQGTGTHPSGIKGFSAESALGASIQDLAKNLPGNYGKVGVTTVGDVRRRGGDVTPTKGRSPTHATVSGLSPEAASKLLNPVVPNPGKK